MSPVIVPLLKLGLIIAELTEHSELLGPRSRNRRSNGRHRQIAKPIEGPPAGKPRTSRNMKLRGYMERNSLDVPFSRTRVCQIVPRATQVQELFSALRAGAMHST